MFNKTKTEIIEKSKSVKNLTVFKLKKFIKRRDKYFGQLQLLY